MVPVAHFKVTSSLQQGDPADAACRRMEAHASDWDAVVQIALESGLSKRAISEGMGVSGNTVDRWVSGTGRPHRDARHGGLLALQNLVRAEMRRST